MELSNDNEKNAVYLVFSRKYRLQPMEFEILSFKFPDSRELFAQSIHLTQ